MILQEFDADKDYKSTLQRLIGESEQLLNDKDIFLFPNSSEYRELEMLLFHIIKEEYSTINVLKNTNNVLYKLMLTMARISIKNQHTLLYLKLKELNSLKTFLDQSIK